MSAAHGTTWREHAAVVLQAQRGFARIRPEEVGRDASALLILVVRLWDSHFRPCFDRMGRNYIEEMREHRNNLAHGGTVTIDDAFRAVDTAWRVASSLRAPETADLAAARQRLLAELSRQATAPSQT